MNEYAVRRTLVRALRDLHAVPVENPARPGTPDVNYVGGWVEIKALPRWPGPNAVVRVRRFSVQQRRWLERRARAGGNAYVLLRVGKDWLLFFATVAVTVLGRCRRSELEQQAVVRVQGSSKIPSTLIEFLRASCRSASDCSSPAVEAG